MTSTATTILDPLAAWSNVVAALMQVPTNATSLRGVDESMVLRLVELQVQASRLLGAGGAVIAGEVAHRSRPALGMGGLAQRTGFALRNAC
jgi:hypothetical protein